MTIADAVDALRLARDDLKQIKKRSQSEKGEDWRNIIILST